MDIYKAKDLLPIIKAHAEGKTIQYYSRTAFNSTWKDCESEDIDFEDEDYEYRIKPEPKYRPFKDAEECWKEMQKHQPFGWLRFENKDDGYIHFYKIRNIGIYFDSTSITFEKAFEYYTFVDGTPFGIKVEE